MAGNYLFAGHLVEQSSAPLWDLPAPDPAFLNEIHGFSWLDDLAAVGDQSTRTKAQEWLWLWIGLSLGLSERSMNPCRRGRRWKSFMKLKRWE